jgi:DNA-binding CsgD family transcriptional regulator
MGAWQSSHSLLARTIVGREAILERLDRLLEVGGSAGQVIAIAGDAGLGKTRLVTALVGQARARGRLVLVGRASPLEVSLPLGALQEALREERRTSPAAPTPDDSLAASFPGLLLPELGTRVRGSDVDRGVLFEAAARYLRARAARAGLVLVLEDLHWADPTSHALVGHLARATRDAPLLIALTYRPDEAPSGSSLDKLRHELARERLGEEVLLGPLTPTGIALMLRDILAVDPDREVLAMVASASAGNPFVIEELVRDAVAGGRLDPTEGRWTVEGPIVLPGTVQEMLLRRVRALNEDEQDVLAWAAVLGERFDSDVLAAVAELTEPAALQVLGRLRSAALVTDGGSDGRLAFRHALTRDAVLGELLGPERRRRHARVLQVAEAHPEAVPGLPLEEMLEHALGAGDRPKSFDYSIQAGGRSVDLGGYQEARSHYERALALWRPGDGLDMRASLFMRLGYLTGDVGGGFSYLLIEPRSWQHFEEARKLYEEIGDMTAAALATAGVVWSGQALDVLDDLRRARERLGPNAPPEAVCQILCRLAEREFLVGNTHTALRISSEGLALIEADSQGSGPGRFTGRWQLRSSFVLTAAIARWWLGDDASGRATMLALADEALQRNDRLWAALAYHTLCRQSLDWPPDAVRYAERGMELAGEDAPSKMAAWFAYLRAHAYVHDGEWEAADASLDRAGALLDDTPDQPFLHQALGMVRGELALGRGELSRAVDILQPLVPEVDASCGRIFRRVMRVGLARALLAEGDLAGARRSLAPLIARWEAAEEGPFMLSALLPMAAVEVASALGDTQASAHWWAELAALGSGPRADYAHALADLTGGLGAARPTLDSVACAVEGDGRRWEGAWMRVAGADVALRAGDADQAARLAAAALDRFRALEAEGWCQRCEGFLRRLGHRVPGRRTPSGAGGLTAREAEVLGLVVDGLSNRAIAERLVISEGTAGRHVANVFAKLGAHSRLEAARIAAERGLLQSADTV